MKPPETGPRVRGEGGVEIATYNFGGDGPPLMLAHATGFHAWCWAPVVPPLLERFNVWATDTRGHGASGKADRYDDWAVAGGDLMAVLDAIGLDGWSGAGHSMGGAVVLMVEGLRPGTFHSLFCYEPVVMPPEFRQEGSDNFMATLALKRRPRFDSAEAARANFASKPPMERFDPDALDAYIAHGFVPDSSGGVTLACQPEAEASTYEGAPNSGVWAMLESVRAPVLVAGGVSGSDPVSGFIEEVARRLPRGGARRLEGLSHFGPMEDPLRIGTLMRDALSGSPSVPETVAPPR